MRATLVVVLLFIAALVWAVPAQAGEKKKIDHVTLSAPIVGWAEFDGMKMPFNSRDPNQPVPPGPEGTTYYFKVVPQITTLAKKVTVRVMLGTEPDEEYPVYGRNAFPMITYTPRIDDAPGVSIWVEMKDAHYSSSDIFAGIGSTTQKVPDFFTCYTPIHTIPSVEWQRVCREIGTPVNGDEIAAAGVVNREIKSRNDAKLETYQHQLAEYREKLAAWEALPRTKSVPGTPGAVTIKRAVVRFLQNGSMAAYNGPFAVVANGREVIRGQATGGQASFAWWEVGTEIAVKYGRNLNLSTPAFKTEGDGILEVTWRSSASRPDAARKAISQSDVLSLLASGRRAGADAVLRVLGTSAQEIETAIKTGSAEVRPVCPGEAFMLASGQPPQTANWSPVVELPAIWVTLTDGRAFALQIVRDCGNFVVGRYCPAPELLQPEIIETKGAPGSSVQCELPPRPTDPEKPIFEKVAAIPAPVYRMPGSATSSGSAQVTVRAQPLDLQWLAWGIIASRLQPRVTNTQTQSQTVNVTCPGCGAKPGDDHGTTCPVGGGPYVPPTNGFPFVAPIQPPSGQDGTYDTGGNNAPPPQTPREPNQPHSPSG